MPWTPDQFRSRHAHDLSPAQSAHAAQIANAILRRSPGSEGMAIATGIARSKGIERAQGGSTHDSEFRSADRWARDNLYTNDAPIYRGSPSQMEEQYRDFTGGPGWKNAPSSSRPRDYPRDYDYEQFLKENPGAGDITVGSRALGGSLGSLGSLSPHLHSLSLRRPSLTSPHLPHFDDGGGVSSGYAPGVTASSDTTASPIYQSLVQRYRDADLADPEPPRRHADQFLQRAEWTQPAAKHGPPPQKQSGQRKD